MVVTLIVTLLLLPVEIAFFSSEAETRDWMVINIIIDVIFLIDIMFNFRTGFIHAEGVSVHSCKAELHVHNNNNMQFLYSAFPGRS